MKIRLGVVMDNIANIQIEKDTTFALLLEAQKREWEIFYMEQSDIFLSNGKVFANVKLLSVKDDSASWFEFFDKKTLPLKELDVILMRKDPPFDLNYIYTTYLLEQAEREGVLVVNKPQGLRDANEKLFANWFMQCCPPTLVTSQKALLKNFIAEHKDIILKPLNDMGGGGIFSLKADDVNVNVAIETLTANETIPIMAQKFIPEVVSCGDKRIIMIDGKPIPYALARIPTQGEIRGNLAAGGTAKGVELTDHDVWICEQVGSTLQKKGLMFVGLDVIGDYLTEINVTSPTGIRQLDKLFNLNISGQLMDCINDKIKSKQFA